MGESAAPLQGPDLARGFRLAEIADGSMLLGHALGEAVIVVRRGEQAFAVSASCPHYGAPLQEGLIVGSTLRCPWHHACFSVESGAVLSPPALNPLTSWQLRQQGGLHFVTAKRSPQVPQRRDADARTFVIVGTGAAGAVAAETLRLEGFSGRLVMIGEDPSAPYDRPNLSKDYLSGHAPEEWIPLRPPEFYTEQQIELRCATRVERLDKDRRVLQLAGGETLAFDALLLATGARPVRLAVPGAELPHVHYLRSLDDSRKLIQAAGQARNAVIVGASFIGLEVAAALVERRLRVSVVGREALPLEHVLGPELGTFVRELHESHGVQFHLQSSPERITDSQVALAGGRTLPADLVVIGVGVRPATELAEAAGLAVDRGILVDEYLETDSPGIFAAGDVARYPDGVSGERVRIEHWVLAQRHGRAAALNMLGRRVPFADVPFFWSNHYEVAIRFSGFAPPGATRETIGSIRDRKYAVAFRKAGRIMAVATVGNDRLNLSAEAALQAADARGLDELPRLAVA
jgi:apoptosis-inducing factor 3